MRPAFERLLCRTRHKWGEWDISDKDSIHCHCLRGSCDKIQRVSYSEYIRFTAMSKIVLNRVLSTIEPLKFPIKRKIKFRRYNAKQAL